MRKFFDKKPVTILNSKNNNKNILYIFSINNLYILENKIKLEPKFIDSPDKCYMNHVIVDSKNNIYFTTNCNVFF